MDTVSFVLFLLAVLPIVAIGAIVWALRERAGKLVAQREIARMAQHPAGYDTGLVERPLS